MWHHLYKLKNVKDTHEECYFSTLLKVTFLQGCFSGFLNCADGTYQIAQNTTYDHMMMMTR